MKIEKLNQRYADEFWRLRLSLFKELGEIKNETNLQALKNATKKYYLSCIGKDLICFGAFENERLVAIGSLCLFERIPYSENQSGKEGYILNVYTEPEFRKQGLAGLILKEIIKYASDEKIGRLWLNASENGKALYAEYGFVSKENEMELML